MKAYKVFNRDTGMQRSDITMPFIALLLTEWMPASNMSDQEKQKNPNYQVAGGYLKHRTHKDAWAEAWANMSQKTKQRFLDLPNFDADIFEQITGVRV